MAKRMVAITTIDNPFDPLEEWEEWYNYDTQKGYYTVNYLARLARTSQGLTDVENDREIERVIDDILRYNPENIYKKVVRELND